jgi:hypothetical protein
MMIELTDQELETLRNLIEERIAELGPEIHHTHARGYRQGLMELRDRLARLDERLAAPAHT